MTESVIKKQQKSGVLINKDSFAKHFKILLENVVEDVLWSKLGEKF